MAAAGAAELLDLELLGLRALVLVSHVVVALAGLAAELDEVTHGSLSVRQPVWANPGPRTLSVSEATSTTKPVGEPPTPWASRSSRRFSPRPAPAGAGRR